MSDGRSLKEYNPELCESLHKSINVRLDKLSIDLKERVDENKEFIINLVTTRGELLDQSHKMQVRSMVESLDAIKNNFERLENAIKCNDEKMKDYILMQNRPVVEEIDDIKESLNYLFDRLEALETFRAKMYGAYMLMMILYPILTGGVIYTAGKIAKIVLAGGF